VLPDGAWLSETWTFDAAALPPVPAVVLEIGCGPLGGFVPALRTSGYDALGVDREAPAGAAYARCSFEDYRQDRPVDAVIACLSLHHVADLEAVLDKMAGALVTGGTAIVVEWARELFDEATARWCFARLDPPKEGAEPGWLQKRRTEYAASSRCWEEHIAEWAGGAGLHTGEEVVRGLDARFDRLACARGPYFWADLAGTSVADEQVAIDTGQIRATAIRYTGVLSRLD
jgi:SAM-dependent methyltransferase